MGTRIVFEFRASPEQENEKWQQVKELLQSAGASYIKEPSGKPPHILTAILPDDIDVDEFLIRFRQVEGVDQADVDHWREAL